MAKVRWLPEALEDLKRLHAFIEPHSTDAARRTVDTMIAAADTLAKFPEKVFPGVWQWISASCRFFSAHVVTLFDIAILTTKSSSFECGTPWKIAKHQRRLDPCEASTDYEWLA